MEKVVNEKGQRDFVPKEGQGDSVNSSQTTAVRIMPFLFNKENNGASAHERR
jgi:hypothetical protein